MTTPVSLRARRTVGDVVLSFEWSGGMYIEVCRGEQFAHPKEVINVGSVEDDDRPEFTHCGMRKVIDEWIADYGPDELLHDVKENWRWY